MESVAPLAGRRFVKEGFMLYFEKSSKQNALLSKTEYQKCFAPKS